MQAYTESSDIRTDPAALGARMNRESYLFFRNFIPADVIHSLRDEMLALIRAEGWVDATGQVISEPHPEGSEQFWSVYDPVQKLQPFHALAHRPEILAVIEALVQDEPFVHPRNIARISFPQAEYFTTPAHQDFVHIQGTPDTYTCWMPLHDCPLDLGGLAVLAGSHHAPVLPVHKASGAGGLGVDVYDSDPRWRTIDYQTGDAIIFHSHTVHKGLPNRTGNRLRLSVDYRYQAVSQPIIADGLLPHYNRLSWDEIYADWPSDAYRYYWRGLGLQTVERDRQYQKSAQDRSEKSAIPAG